MRFAFAWELCQTWQGPSFISRGDYSSVTFIGNIDWHQEGTSLAGEHSISCRHCKNLPERVAFWTQSNKEKEVSMGVSEGHPPGAPPQQNVGILRGRSCRRGRNIAHGHEIRLLGGWERWFFMGIKKYHKQKTPKLGSGAAQ